MSRELFIDIPLFASTPFLPFFGMAWESPENQEKIQAGIFDHCRGFFFFGEFPIFRHRSVVLLFRFLKLMFILTVQASAGEKSLPLRAPLRGVRLVG